jgi:hypothetical protein
VRAEDIVGISFFALLLCAIVVTLCGSRTILTPRQQAAWRGWGLSLISIALVAFGLVNFQLIHTSPRPVVEGTLWDIREEFKNGSTRFMITDATGQAVMILCNHRGPGFVQGERARVRYVAYNNKRGKANSNSSVRLRTWWSTQYHASFFWLMPFISIRRLCPPMELFS